MTLLEKITELQSQGLSSEEVFAQAQEFKGRIKPEETEVVEEITEPVKEVEVVEEIAKTQDSAGVDPTVESNNTGSEPVDGSSELPVEEIAVDAPVGSEERKQQYVDKGWAFDDTIPGNEEEKDIINQLPLDVDLVEKFGEETIMISMGEYERSGFDMDAKINPNSNVTYAMKGGGQKVSVLKSDFYNSPPQIKKREEYFKFVNAIEVDAEETLDTAGKNYFGLEGLEKATTGGLSAKFGDNYKDEYVKLSKTEAQALGITKDMKGRSVGQDGQPPNARYNYDDYLKGKLGDRYDEYVKFKEKPDEFEFPANVLKDSESKEKEKKIQNYLRELNDDTFQEGLKPFAEAQLNNEKIKLDVAKKALESKSKILKDTKSDLEKRGAELKRNEEPFVAEINKSIENFTKAYGPDILKTGLTEDQLKDPEVIEQYNGFVESYTAAQTAYEKQGFEDQYELLTQDQNVFSDLVDNFNSGLENNVFDGTKLEQAEMSAKALNMDYSLSARAGAALEDFFVGGTKNVASMVGQAFLKVAKGMTTDANGPKLDAMIKSMEQNITNYNVKIAAEREATIPAPLDSDDIDGIGGTFRYIGEALADNSPSILTTFLPLGAGLAGGMRVAAAARLAGAAGKSVAKKAIAQAAMKTAVKAQKTYAMFAMRSSQAIFFTGESGGKYGEIQVGEDKAKKALPALQERFGKMVVGEGGVTQEDKNALAEEIADNKRMSNYSFANKAFTSFGYGATAALAETMGSLKFVTGGAKLAKNYGKVVAKKAAYESMGKYRLQLAKTYIKGMAPLVTKAAPTEVMEEGLTQIGHNSFDIIALGEDKSMFEGINKDFLLKTAITSFAIGGPTTMQGTVNLLKNEVRTKQEVDANKLKVNELLNIEARKETGKPLSKIDQKRKTELITEMAFDDALTTNKMAALTVSQIEEVGEINRQQRAYVAQMKGLGSTGDVASDDSKQAQKSIRDQSALLDAKKQEILGTKNKTIAQKGLDLKERFSSKSAIDIAKYSGLNDFANDAAMVLSAKGKKYVAITSLDAAGIKAELEAAGYSDAQVEGLLPKLTGDAPSNGLQLDGDIIVNQAAIDQRIYNAVDSSDAAYAAVAPLEELFHADLRDKKMVDKNGDLGEDTTAAIDEAMEQIESSKELGSISEEDYNGLKERFDFYKNNEGQYDMEEVMAQINNAMILGAINKSDFTNMNSTKAMLNGIVGQVLGGNSWMLNVKTGSDMFNMLDKFQDRVADKDSAQGLGDDDEVQDTEALGKSKEPEAKESKGSQILNRKLAKEAKRGNIESANRLVDENDGLILNQLGYNKDIGNIEASKLLQVVKDQVVGQGMFEGRQAPLLKNYDGSTEVSTYLGSVVAKRKAEIYKAAGLDPKKFVTSSLDSEQAKQVADTSVQQDFDAKETKKDTSRKKIYPSQMESISKTIKPETIAEVKQDASREILLNSKKGPEAIVKSIRNEGKNIAKKLGKDTGTFAKGWPNFVKDLVKDGLTKVIPAAALKRRFGAVLGIEQTGVTPTKRTNPKTGKVTNFNKGVYSVPKASDQDLIDYFTGQEKRRTSLLEVLGQDLVVEQMQELMADQDFMSKLDTATDGKAIEIMESVDNDLDTRKLEDTSLDNVKASQGKALPKVKVLTPSLINKFNDMGRLKDKNAVGKELGYDTETINENNYEVYQELLEQAFSNPAYGLDSLAFEGSAMANSGRLEVIGVLNNDGKFKLLSKDEGGKKYYKVKDGEYLAAPQSLDSREDWIPARNRIFYGKTDPAYVRILDSTNKYKGKAARLTIPKGKNINKPLTQAWKTKNKTQENTNKKARRDYVNQLQQAYLNGMDLSLIGILVTQSAQATTGLLKISAPFKGVSKKFEKGDKKDTGELLYREEHNPPASVVAASIMYGVKTNSSDLVNNALDKNFSQTQLSKKDDSKIDDNGYAAMLPVGTSIFENPITRLTKSGIDLDSIIDLETGKTFAELNNVGVDTKNNPNIVEVQNKLVEETQDKDNDVTPKVAQERINTFEAIGIKESRAGKLNIKNLGDKVSADQSIVKQIETLGNYDKAAALARSLNTPEKGISVFDFDDTLARTKEKVLYTTFDGKEGSLSAKQFAEQATDLESNGVTFDFSEFDNVVNAKKGPLADLALKRQDKFGSKDIFVLTARPQQSAAGIKMFLDGIGLNLPFENITGLENGSPQAKASWVVGKASEGYNDFYFADDAISNVKAVGEVLDQIDVKSKVQQAKASKGKVFKTVMNDIVSGKTGIKPYQDYSSARAKTVGKGKGAFDMFIPPSAEDFKGLLYKLLGKGKVGDAQFQFFQDNLLDPYNKAENALITAKMAVARDFKALKDSLKSLPKSLSKQTGIGGFTFSQAVRVAAWTRQGMEVPGLSKRDVKELNSFVEKNSELNTLVDELIKIQKGKPYPKPGKNWLAGNITSDIVNEINTVNRKEYMQEFNENVDLMFDDAMFNKLEAAYGPNYVEAVKDSIRRMKSGSNRAQGGGRIVDSMLDWLNNSVGAVMFLNTRSGLLQMLSAVNFINFGNNNLLKAGKAFLNQKQYWSDFMSLLNSDYLTERRNGLKINVSESEIADAVKDSKNKPKAAIAYLLSQGFIFTRIADSFAIAAGGSTFYRNQVEAYVKEGLSKKDAEAKAFQDFRAVAEETQQSSNPSKISQQQASGIGRVVLAFANTPMQYARIIKRSSQDLINGRGDWRANVSKIVYYSTVQNLIFNALQQALFALAFDDEDETDEEKKAKLEGKKGRIANGMADSLLRGMGYGGAMVSTLKNVLLKIADENSKKSPKYVLAVDELLSFSPPLDSKLRKLKSAANTMSWNGKDMKEKGFSLNNPAYLSVAQVVSATTNIPLDRAIQKINNLRAVASNSSENWQKVAMLLGWSTWDVGLPYYGVDEKIKMTPQMILKKKVETMAKETSTKDQKQLLLDLGLTKQEIKALKYEDIRVKKIIELQEKNKK